MSGEVQASRITEGVGEAHRPRDHASAAAAENTGKAATADAVVTRRAATIAAQMHRPSVPQMQRRRTTQLSMKRAQRRKNLTNMAPPGPHPKEGQQTATTGKEKRIAMRRGESVEGAGSDEGSLRAGRGREAAIAGRGIGDEDGTMMMETGAVGVEAGGADVAAAVVVKRGYVACSKMGVTTSFITNGVQ